MKDLRRIPLVAIVLIVVLRIAIGWQFLYEGLWKVSTLSTPTPWTSEGYLKNAMGPLREHFREMTGDPDDFKWLDYAEMSRRWYDWRDRFVQHYALTPEQTAALNKLIDGSAETDSAPDELPPPMNIRVTVEALPADVDLKKLNGAVTYDAAKKQLVADAPILPSEEATLLRMVDVAVAEDGKTYTRRTDKEAAPDKQEEAFYKAASSLIRSSRNLSFRHKLASSLRGDPENAGVTAEKNPKDTFDIVMGTTTAKELSEKRDNIRYGKIQEYKDLVKEYNDALDKAAIDYQYDHATMLGRKLAAERAGVVAPVKSLDKSLRSDALGLLDYSQIKRGAVPPAPNPLQKSDRQVILGLVALGLLLIMGLFTRGAAILGAIMMLMFYLVMPPWPGIPPAPGLTEHSLFINKNMIEAIALIGIAAMPTGSWFGIDGLIYRLWSRRRVVRK